MAETELAISEENAVDVLRKVEAVLFSGGSPFEKLTSIHALLPKVPGKLEELLSKHPLLPGIWQRQMALFSEAAPLLTSPRVLGWLAKQAVK